MMRKELTIGITLIGIYGLSTAAFTRGIKDNARKQRPDIPQGRRTETHHVDPVYRGGEDTENNAQCLTLPEHAQAHWNLMIQARGRTAREDREANSWAVKKIVSRMTTEELIEFNQLIGRRKKK